MKMYYLSFLFYVLLMVSPVLAFSDDFKSDEIVEVQERPLAEIDPCAHVNFDKDDEFKLLIDNFSDEKFIKAIFLSKLLEKNHSLYLCEIDKMIDGCFKLNNKKLNLRNVIRLLKATTFFACSAGCAYIGYCASKTIPKEMTANQRNLGLAIAGIAGSFFGIHGVSELQTIWNNYDQNQCYYKAIAMKNALLDYRKK